MRGEDQINGMTVVLHRDRRFNLLAEHVSLRVESYVAA